MPWLLNAQLRAAAGDGDDTIHRLVWHAGADVHPRAIANVLINELANAQHRHQRGQRAGDLQRGAVGGGHDVGRTALGVVAGGDAAHGLRNNLNGD